MARVQAPPTKEDYLCHTRSILLNLADSTIYANPYNPGLRIYIYIARVGRIRMQDSFW